MEAEWMEALPRLRQRMGERNFATWIEPVQVQRGDAEGWRLEVPSRFFQEWLSRHFLGTIRESAAVQARWRRQACGWSCARPGHAVSGARGAPAGDTAARGTADRRARVARAPAARRRRLAISWPSIPSTPSSSGKPMQSHATRPARLPRSPGRRFNPFFCGAVSAWQDAPDQCAGARVARPSAAPSRRVAGRRDLHEHADLWLAARPDGSVPRPFP